jgi:hypothetical protein
MSRDITLWSCIAAGPVVWMLAFGANWSIAWWACIWQWTPGQYAIWIAAMLLTVLGGTVSWRQWRSVGAGVPAEAGGVNANYRALAIGGMMLNATAFLLLAAQMLVTMLVGACQ